MTATTNTTTLDYLTRQLDQLREEKEAAFQKWQSEQPYSLDYWYEAGFYHRTCGRYQQLLETIDYLKEHNA